MEWNKLAQNPFLAFYQRWPWLCPKYSDCQSLETHRVDTVVDNFIALFANTSD